MKRRNETARSCRASLIRGFRRPDFSDGLTVFAKLSSYPPTAQEVEALVRLCEKRRFPCLIPLAPDGYCPGERVIEDINETYCLFLNQIESSRLSLGFSLDLIAEEAFLQKTGRDDWRGYVLNRYEYYCTSGEVLSLPIEGDTVALSLFDNDSSEYTDLSSYVKNGTLDYIVPEGNYSVERFYLSHADAVTKTTLPGCNRLNKSRYDEFLAFFFSSLDRRITDAFGKKIRSLHYRDIAFHAPNRRNWDFSFDECFTQKFGFSPTPHYPILFHSSGVHNKHLKSLFCFLYFLQQ